MGDGHRAAARRLRHSLAPPDKAAIIYRATGNLRAVQILLGHAKIESTVRYLGVDVEDALMLAEALRCDGAPAPLLLRGSRPEQRYCAHLGRNSDVASCSKAGQTERFDRSFTRPSTARRGYAQILSTE